jgi:hypothetical protein
VGVRAAAQSRGLVRRMPSDVEVSALQIKSILQKRSDETTEILQWLQCTTTSSFFSHFDIF